MGNNFMNQSVDTKPARTSASINNFSLEYHLHPGGISKTGVFKELLKNAENSICKIKEGGNSYGTGFLTKIPDPTEEDKQLRVLISCNHVINKNQIEQLNQISIEMKNKKIINLPLAKRKIWTNSDFYYDYICIEIFKDDGFNYFLTIDENIIQHNYSIQEYIDAGIYVFGFEEDSDIGYDIGWVTEVENNMMFHYNLNTNPGWSGGAVINKDTSSIIAVHKGGDKDEGYNSGIFIKVIIENIKENNYFKIIEHHNPLNSSLPGHRPLRTQRLHRTHSSHSFHNSQSISSGYLLENNSFIIIEKNIPNHDKEKIIILGVSDDFPHFENYELKYKKPSIIQIMSSYKKAKYVFFIFDITKKKSFNNTKKYMEILKFCLNSNDAHKILLGYCSRLNKKILSEFRENILSKQREALPESFILDDYFYELKQASKKTKDFKTISDEESEKLANSWGMMYFEIYPFMNYDTFFDSIIRLIFLDESKS